MSRAQLDRPSRRWLILALLFGATVINYVDRQTLSILSATLREQLGLTDGDYANVVSAFLLSYMVMYSVSGLVIDRIGARLGIFLCVGWWSLASMLTGLATNAASLAGSRFLLGVGEPGIFPGGLKVCAEWFPGRLRATAAGIFSSGVALGAVIAAPLVVWMSTRFGWRMAFVIPGLAGLCWLPLWWWTYRKPAIMAADQAAGRAPEVAAARPWRERLRDRRLWAVLLPRLASDPVWYFYLFWLPDYLQRIRHLSLAEIGLYVWIPFLFADLGNVFGGVASDFLIRRGWTPPRARVAILISVAAVAPFGAAVGLVESTAVAIGITCMITFLCQAWSTNIATLAVDLAAPRERASWVGFMGTSGSLGGMIFAQVLGVTIAALGYSSAFVLAAVLHPVAAITLVLLLRPWLRAGPRPAAAGL